MSFIKVEDLHKTYGDSHQSFEVLRGISLEVSRGEFISLMGPSGAGKSTFLQLLGALDKPTRGEVEINGNKLGPMSDHELTLFRRRHMGFIFQFFNLMPTLTAVENVALPCLLDGKKMKSIKTDAAEILGRLGLSNRLDHKPHQLSGGEMQRVAIARALMNKPSLILADEPTGNLDSKSGAEVLQMLKELVKEFHTTLVMVTHDHHAAQFGNRIINMIDGRVV